MIPLYEPYIPPNVSKAVKDQVASGWVGPGKKVAEFEERLADYLGVKHVVCTTSGTMALFVVLKTLNLHEETRVLFPAYGMIAGAHAAKMCGYQVCLQDVLSTQYCINASYRRGDVIIHICQNGRDGSIEGYVDHHERFGYPYVIQDACQQLGLQKPIAKVSVYSFSPQKLITTGQGGAIATSNDELAEKCRNLIDHGGDWRHDRTYKRLGVNLRMNDIQAAMGIAQLDMIDELLERKREVFKWYAKHINRNMMTWLVEYWSRNAAKVSAQMRKRGVDAQVLYKPNNHNAIFKDQGPFPHAEAVAQSMLYLPSSLTLTEEQVDQVCNVLLEEEAKV